MKSILKNRKRNFGQLERAQILVGQVQNINSYGAFVDIGGVVNLSIITYLRRVNHPEEVVTLDQEIDVVVLDFDDQKKRIALGLKQLKPHPWDSLDKTQSYRQRKGKVVVIAD